MSSDYSRTERKLANLRAQREAERHLDCATPGCRLAEGHAGLHRFPPLIDELRARASAAEAKLAKTEQKLTAHHNTRGEIPCPLCVAESREKALLALLAGLKNEWLRHGPDCAKTRYGNSNAECDCGVREWHREARAALAAGKETDREGGAHGSHV